MEIVKNLSEILSHQNSLLALGGLFVLSLALVKSRKVDLNARIITHIGLALALAVILKSIRLYHFPQGGSVTLGSMVPILVIALFYGPELGFLTGFLYGLLTLIMDPYILHPVQVLFDYPLPFMSLGVAGYFKDREVVGSLLAVISRFIFHFISGVVFFGSYAPEGMSPVIYSLSLNGSYLAVEGIICLVVIGLLPLDRLRAIAVKKKGRV